MTYIVRQRKYQLETKFYVTMKKILKLYQIKYWELPSILLQTKPSYLLFKL